MSSHNPPRLLLDLDVVLRIWDGFPASGAVCTSVLHDHVLIFVHDFLVVAAVRSGIGFHAASDNVVDTLGAIWTHATFEHLSMAA